MVDIQDGGLISTRLQKLLRIQGRLAPRLEESVIPTIQVADLAVGAAPPMCRCATASVGLAAVAAEFGQFRMEVPAGVIAVIRKFKVVPAADDFLKVFFGTSILVADLGTVHTSTFTDGRQLAGPGPELPAAVLRSGNRVATLATTNWRMEVNAQPNQNWQEPSSPWVVGTGNPATTGFIEFQLGTVNVAAQSQLEWDEYQLF